MLNHLRTLLLHQSGATAPGTDYPGEEVVPTSYVPPVLPAGLRLVHEALFPPGCDRAFRNVRLRQLLYPLHAGELAPYALESDPRLTYWPARSDGLFRALAFGTAARLESGDVRPLYLLGNPADFAAADSVLYRRWRVTVADAGSVTVAPLVPSQDVMTVPYTITGGLSSIIPLLGDRLALRFGDGSTNYPTWDVTALLQPATGIPEVVAALRRLDTRAVFAGEQTEPLSTLRRVWQSSAPDSLALSALVLALAYQIDEVRRRAA